MQVVAPLDVVISDTHPKPPCRSVIVGFHLRADVLVVVHRHVRQWDAVQRLVELVSVLVVGSHTDHPQGVVGFRERVHSQVVGTLGTAAVASNAVGTQSAKPMRAHAAAARAGTVGGRKLNVLHCAAQGALPFTSTYNVHVQGHFPCNASVQ